MALVAYRNLMRAARVAFQGDAQVLAAARQKIRQEFRRKSGMEPSDSTTKEALFHAQEVAKFLRANVVQGKRLEGEDNMYQLRIHKDTERGDNESIKAGGSGAIGGGGCCGGSGR
ncbi:uncharacterized protein UV8b_05552 [Ustilaginoidea virens]|uniref:Mitochondrial zinc maintenance protein 1, mitochondrial n=1 Tax=Ustilaginoidea virens TaxID=1159556 RepID=A0A1B5L1R4_USTVR|nr:uncharacterized protein UV8b_05552 [Ustilaginoidea virens]QUC21309.1 hypothetical protein UV8b_05552 [Ustilaginoidea virens]GAO17322.1 hypothetical protein UVI_02044800 [Ustilaginoidea virens]